MYFAVILLSLEIFAKFFIYQDTIHGKDTSGPQNKIAKILYKFPSGKYTYKSLKITVLVRYKTAELLGIEVMCTGKLVL